MFGFGLNTILLYVYRTRVVMVAVLQTLNRRGLFSDVTILMLLYCFHIIKQYHMRGDDKLVQLRHSPCAAAAASHVSQ